MKHFTVYSPAASDEDAEPVTNERMIIVCDGLGATGQNKHEIDGEIRSSAYLGSRCVCDAAEKFFSQNADKIWFTDAKNICQEFKDFLTNYLSDFINTYHLQKTIKGKSAELLPTTLAMAIFRENEGDIDIFTIWAGDSRVYLLSSNEGLQQISKDDVYGTFDAMESLELSNMRNSISGEGIDKFYLNYKRYNVKKQPNLFLFASSDGCFDYLASPMDFEYLLELSINKLPENDEISSIGTMISSFYCGNNLKDDSTMAGVIFNETNLNELKRQYEQRYKYVMENYRKPTEECICILGKCDSEINAALPEINKEFKVLSRQVIAYVCDVLDDKQSGTNNFTLKEQIRSLPCMEGYNKHIQESSKKIEKQKASIEYEEAELKRIEKNINESFFKEFVPLYIGDKRMLAYSQTGSMQNYLRRYFKKKKAKSDAAALLQGFSRDVLKIFENMKMYIEAEDNFKFAREKDKLDQIVLKIKEIGKNVFKDDIYNEQKLYSLFSDELSNSSEARSEYRRAWSKGFQEYPMTMEMYKKYKYIEEKIDSYKEAICKIKDSETSFQFINSMSAEFVNAFIEIQGLKELIPSDLYNKIQHYKSMCERQDCGKKLINQKRRDIDNLWREKYKNVYELYNKAIFGGEV